jgi:hypothetical protein
MVRFLLNPVCGLAHILGETLAACRHEPQLARREYSIENLAGEDSFRRPISEDRRNTSEVRFHDGCCSTQKYLPFLIDQRYAHRALFEQMRLPITPTMQRINDYSLDRRMIAQELTAAARRSL